MPIVNVYNTGSLCVCCILFVIQYTLALDCTRVQYEYEYMYTVDVYRCINDIHDVSFLRQNKGFGHIGDAFYCGGTKWGRIMSGLENGDGLNKCIIPRPHSRVEVVPRSTTKSDKTGTVLKVLHNDV